MLIESGHAFVDEPAAVDGFRSHRRRVEEGVDGEPDLSWLLDDPCLALPGRTEGPGAFAHHVLAQLRARLETERIAAGLPPTRQVWEHQLEPTPFDDAGPPLLLRSGAPDEGGGWQSPDVRLVLAQDLPAEASGRELDTWAWQTFGTSWNASGPSTDVLRTRFEERSVRQPGRASRRVRRLSHQPFAQVFRVESRATAPRLVTFRTFLALADHAEDPTLWLRLDAFQRELEPGPNVVARGATSPLLLPRGSEAGMRFRILVLLTEDGADSTPAARGARHGAGGELRDGRPPAFPFCHAFPHGIEASFTALDHAALRDVTIRHEPSGRWRDGRR